MRALDVTDKETQAQYTAFVEDLDNRAFQIINWREWDTLPMPGHLLTFPVMASVLKEKAPNIYGVVAAWVAPHHSRFSGAARDTEIHRFAYICDVLRCNNNNTQVPSYFLV